MPEIVPDEGLDYLLGVVFKAATQPTNVYLGLFTSQTASTVPANTAVLATASGVTEAAYTGYARVAIPTSDWGSAATQTIWSQTVRALTAAQKTFPVPTVAYSTPITGFLIASTLTVGTGVALLYSNFSDSTAIASLAIGDQVKISAQFGLGG